MLYGAMSRMSGANIMRLDWANVSAQELWWTTPAVLAFLVTLALLVWALRSFGAIRAKIRGAPSRYRAWGPRWNFSLLLIVTMGAFAVAWVIGIALGVIAMMTPPPISQANREAAVWFAALFIFRDIMFALAEAMLWTALRSLADAPIIPRFRWRRAGRS